MSVGVAWFPDYGPIVAGIFSLHISPKHEIKLNQNPRSSCTSTNWRKPMAAWSCISLLKYFLNLTCMDEKNQKVTSGHKKNYETYNRSTRVLFSNKYLCQVTLHKLQMNSNNFDFDKSKHISSYFSLSRSIFAYPGLSCYVCQVQLSRINDQR